MGSVKKKRTTSNLKPLSKKINKLIYKRGDICCSEDIDKQEAITFILNKYNTDLASLANDIPIFIGIKDQLVKDNDKLGNKLWDEMDKKLYVKDEPKLKNIVKMLNELPLYYLLAFIGKFPLNNRVE